MRLMLSATLLSVAIGMGTAWAQAPAPSPMSQDQKKAISKSCTDQPMPKAYTVRRVGNLGPSAKTLAASLNRAAHPRNCASGGVLV
jgi:hypothetical protein